MQAQQETGFSPEELQSLSGYDLTPEILDSLSERREYLEELMGKKLTALEAYRLEWDKGSHPQEDEADEE